MQAQTKEGVLGGERSLQCSCGENSCVDTLWSSADLKGAGLTKGTYSVPADVVGCSDRSLMPAIQELRGLGDLGSISELLEGNPQLQVREFPRDTVGKVPFPF